MHATPQLYLIDNLLHIKDSPENGKILLFTNHKNMGLNNVDHCHVEMLRCHHEI